MRKVTVVFPEIVEPGEVIEALFDRFGGGVTARMLTVIDDGSPVELPRLRMRPFAAFDGRGSDGG